MLDDWVRFWDVDVDGVFDFLDVGNVDGFVVGNGHWNLLDDGQSLLLMVMVVGLFVMVMMGLFVMNLVAEVVALVTVAVGAEVMTAEVMIEQAALVLLFALLSLSLDWLLLLLLSLLLCGDAKEHQHGNAEEHLELA